MTPLDFCTGCGQRPTCAKAEAAVLVVGRNAREDITSLCRVCRRDARQETAPVAQEKGK
jgi:hypothetical protein